MAKNEIGRKKVPTMYDIAALAGVSVATVSYVLNPESAKFVSEAYRQKVVEAAQALNYRPNFLARGMRGKRRRTIAVLVPQFENILFTRMVMAAEQVAFTFGYVLLICSTYDIPEREKVYIDNLLSQQVDGFLIAPTVSGTVNTKLIRDQRVPYVIIDRQLTNLDPDSYNYVGFDNRLGAELATEHLINNGHQRIAFIGWRSKIVRISDRAAGFQSAVERNGLGLTDCPILLGNHSRLEGERLTRELLAEMQVTAILAGHQYMGEGVFQALKELGKSIPSDLSLVVYGQPTWTELTTPSLTCIKMPDAEIGERAARILIDQLEGNTSRMEQVIFKPSLAKGSSVANIGG